MSEKQEPLWKEKTADEVLEDIRRGAEIIRNRKAYTVVIVGPNCFHCGEDVLTKTEDPTPVVTLFGIMAQLLCSDCVDKYEIVGGKAVILTSELRRRKRDDNSAL